jgi:hypothetical protein
METALGAIATQALSGIKGKGKNIAIAIRNHTNMDLVHVRNTKYEEDTVGIRTNIEACSPFIAKNGGTGVIQLSSGTSYLGGFNCEMYCIFRYKWK